VTHYDIFFSYAVNLVESEMSSCPLKTNYCDDADSIVVARSTISDCFSTVLCAYLGTSICCFVSRVHVVIRTHLMIL
jgi:hypothetical protein